MNGPTCTCKGYEYRQECKHVHSVEKAIAAGASFGFPLTFRSLTHATTTYMINRTATGQENA